MIGKIGPLVERRASKADLLLHVAGGTLGGVLTGLVLGVTGASLAGAAPNELAWGMAVALPLVLLLAGMVDLGITRGRWLTLGRQTPGSWACSLGTSGGIFAWGVDLGLGVATRFPFQSLVPVYLFALLVGDVVAAVAVTALYGFTKSLTVALAVARSAPDFPGACTWIARHSGRARLAAGSASVAVSFVVFVSGI
jgi:hypothetical protein